MSASVSQFCILFYALLRFPVSNNSQINFDNYQWVEKKKKFGFGGFHSLKIICIVRTRFTFEIWKLSFSSTRREQKRSQTQFRKFLCVHIFELNLCSLEFDEMLLFSTHTYAHITSLRWKTKQEWRWQSKWLKTTTYFIIIWIGIWSFVYFENVAAECSAQSARLSSHLAELKFFLFSEKLFSLVALEMFVCFFFPNEENDICAKFRTR